MRPSRQRAIKEKNPRDDDSSDEDPDEDKHKDNEIAELAPKNAVDLATAAAALGRQRSTERLVTMTSESNASLKQVERVEKDNPPSKSKTAY